MALGLPGFIGLTMVVSRLSFCSGREGERRACEGGGIGFRPRARRLRARSGASGGVGGARGAVEQRDARADGLNGWDVAGDATERFAWLTASLPECKDCRDLSRDFDLDKVAGVAAASAIVLDVLLGENTLGPVLAKLTEKGCERQSITMSNFVRSQPHQIIRLYVLVLNTPFRITT